MLALLCAVSAMAPVQAPTSLGPLVPDAALDAKVRAAVEKALVEFTDRGAKPGLVAVAYVELDRAAGTAKVGHFRGGEGFYPASVVKLFWLAYAHRRLEDRAIRMSPEFQRSLEDMIRESSNDATHLVVDVTTGTTGGPELGEREMARWAERRNAANRWFASMGYEGINVNQKTWCEGPYGRERAFYGKEFTNRNKLTALATVRLMSEIAMGRCVSAERSAQMLALLGREIPADGGNADAQSAEYTGKALPKGAKLWSKAGWTDTARHDVAYVRLPSGKERVLSVFTFQLANVAGLIPFIAGELIKD
jgi:beta-lactamase class A